MSDRRLREDVEVHSFFDPDLEIVLKSRDALSDPDKWIQGGSAWPVTYSKRVLAPEMD